ncbi:DMT family transporter [Alphaproteobacteria bacterium]|jgi:drug/metabolite transporter (DMT)-like permease|nr:DMT family transporter [Alphaproteobacteria bacterium]MDB3863566.1 DMT family transporter [Alphaproteobacteria bacterium]
MFSKQFTATLCLIGAALIWGTAFVAQTTGMEFVGPLTFTNIRFIIGGLLVLPFALKEVSRFNNLIKKKRLIIIILLTGFCLLMGSYLQQYALQYTKIGNAAFLTILYVPFVPIISRFFLKKSIHWSIWVSVSICLIGSYYLTIENSFEAQFADFLVIICAVFFALHCILIDEYFEIVDAPFSLASAQFLLCFIYSLPFMFIFENPTIDGILKESFEILYVGVMSVGIAYTLQVIGQRIVKPSTAAITFSLEGVFGALAAWIILSQFLTIIQIFGCFLILLGVLTAQLIPLFSKGAASNRYHTE